MIKRTQNIQGHIAVKKSDVKCIKRGELKHTAHIVQLQISETDINWYEPIMILAVVELTRYGYFV